MKLDFYYGNHVDAVDDSDKDKYHAPEPKVECAFCKDDVPESESVYDKDSMDNYCFDCMRKGRFITHLQSYWDGTTVELDIKIKELNQIYISQTK